MPTRRPKDASTAQSAPPDLLTVAQTAAVLRCGLTFVYESIHRYRATGDADEIPGLKVGRSLRVPRVRLERYIGGSPHRFPSSAHRANSRLQFDCTVLHPTFSLVRTHFRSSRVLPDRDRRRLSAARRNRADVARLHGGLAVDNGAPDIPAQTGRVQTAEVDSEFKPAGSDPEPAITEGGTTCTHT